MFDVRVTPSRRRFPRPRSSRGASAKQARDMNRSQPQTRQFREREQAQTRPQARFIRVREHSMSALSPRPRARSQTVRIREHIAISTVRDQALAADTNCPQPVRSLDLSTSPNSSPTRIRRDPRPGRNCPRRRILHSILSPAHFPARVRIIPIFPSSAVTNALSAPTSRAAGRPLSPSRPHPFRYAASALVTSDNLPRAAVAAGFRLRLGDGRCAPAAIRYALLFAFHSTFPARRPQTEASPGFSQFPRPPIHPAQIFQSVIEESSVGHFPRPQKRIFRSLIEKSRPWRK